MTKLSVYIQGGLGNQLFQIFTLLSVCKEQSLDYEILRMNYSPSVTSRKTYYNELFCGLNLVEKYSKNYIRYNEVNDMKYVHFPKFEKDSLLHGYFQSDKYLTSIRDNILSYISLKEEDKIKVNNKLKELKEKAEGKELIFVHIRHGDYIRLSHFHYVLPLEYYQKALSTFDKDKTFFVFFSDDIHFCKSNFKDILNKEFIEMEDYLELMLMSEMDGAIIANSSFSWWGAFLLELKRKDNKCKIIQPERWFTTRQLYPNDRLKCEWITI
jgi:hypothetical protein